MSLKGVLFRAGGVRATTVDGHFESDWNEADLANVFAPQVGVDKLSVRMWSAATYKPGYSRCEAGIDTLHAVILDCDCADVGRLDEVLAAMSRSGLAWHVHTSWSHRASGKVHGPTGIGGPFDAFRLVLPLSRPVLPAEYRVLVPALIGNEVPADPPEWAAERRTGGARGWDQVSRRPTQAYFLPATPAETAHLFQSHLGHGAPIDVDAVLRRPSTDWAWAPRERPYSAPTARAAGALRDVDRAMRGRGVFLGAESSDGWRRAPCPVCAPTGVQKSPSFLARANGDFVDVVCFSGCRRRQILEVLGLDDAGHLAEPGELVTSIERQLLRQAPEQAPVPVAQAGEKLLVDLQQAVESREPTVIQYAAGSGKSWASAQVITARVRAGQRVCYATQEHRVAAETRAYLPPDIRARSVHLHSPLLPVAGDPVCPRAAELHDRVFTYGVSLLGKICPRCPLRDTCEAYKATKERFRQAESAAAVFVSHAGIDQVFGEGKDGQLKGTDVELIVDEMPSVMDQVEVTPDQLRRLVCAELPSAAPTIAKVVRELARAWLSGEEPGQVTWGPNAAPLGSAVELASEWERLTVRDDASPAPTEHADLEAADALVRLAAHHAAGRPVDGLQARGTKSLVAMLPDSCHSALVRRRGTLLTATPLLPALTGFNVKSCNVADGAPVRRVMVPREGRGAGALKESHWDALAGRRVRRPRQPGEPPAINWVAVDAALERAVTEALQYQPARVLFVSFKFIADALRRDPARLRGGQIQVAHYGAVRGKNDWMENREHECSVVYLFGAPRFRTMETLQALGLVGDAARDAWVDYAAGEMTQAEGRLRLPRRTKPCTVFAEGDVAPSTWHVDNVDEWDLGPDPDTALALRERACFWRSETEVDELLADGEPLAELARPGIQESMRLLAELHPRRQALLAQEFTWCCED